MPGTLFSCLQEKVQENKGLQALRCSRADMGRWWLESGPSGRRWGQSPSFSCISCKPSPMCSPAAEQQAPLGYGRQRPSFNVPRLCRGVHRPAAAALRSGAGGVGVVGMAALPRLRWLRGQPPVGGWGEAPASLARLRGHWSILSGSGGLNS